VFEKMHKKTSGSRLIISHLERILNIADKIVVVADGQIKQYGKKDDILPALLGKTATTCQTLINKN
jgi:Fe-S cluster assembly ATP-binding protein